jgi:hypothetical protein
MLITILVVLLLLALALYGVRLLPFDGNILLLIQVVLVVIAIIYIAQAAGIAWWALTGWWGSGCD